MTEKDLILIENYLKGLLSENERESFLKRLDSDAVFKKQFKLEAQLFETLNESDWSFVDKTSSEIKGYKELLDDDDMETLKSKLSEVNADFNAKSKPGNRRFFYYLAAASLVVFFATQFFFNQAISNQDLYNNYINTNNLPSFATRSNGNNTEIQLVEAEQLFDAKNYQDALSIFEPILETESTNVSLYIHTGIAQAESNQFIKAETTFNKLINNKSIDGSIGYWYKALLYLKQDKVKETKAQLNLIIDNSYYNSSKAKELLSQLEDE